jgi:hypothetical protein
MNDAGVDAGGEDAGKLVWMPPEDDSSDDDASGDDSGDDPLAGRECAKVREVLPDALLPRCSATTRDCVAACPDAEDLDACREACLKADDTPTGDFGIDCQTCVFANVFGCIDAAGCHDGVAAFFCCLQDRCAVDNPPENCGQALCGSELQAAVTCGYFAQESCVDYLGAEVGACFPEYDGDGGV